MSVGELAQKVALITGASLNIGQAIARHLATGGATVALNVKRSIAEGEGTATAIKRADGNAFVFPADIRRPEAVAAMVSSVVDRFGRIDFLINNAAVRIGTDDGHGFRDVIAPAIQIGKRLRRRHYLDWVSDLKPSLPVPVPFCGVGIFKDGRLHYRRLDRIIQAVAPTSKRSVGKATLQNAKPEFLSPLVEWPAARPLPRFSFACKKAWQSATALGLECIELERQATLASIGKDSGDTAYARWRTCNVARLEKLASRAIAC